MELAIIIFYLIAIFGVGIYCNKFNNTIDDYLLAGRRLGLGLATGTLVATYFGGGYVIGVGSEAYQMGASSYWSPIAGAVGILAVCLVLKKMEGMRVYTVTEIMENRYQSPLLRLLTTILSLLALLGILAGQINSAGSILASLGIGNTTVCAIIVSVFFVGFTAFGGLWAVTVTDFIQIIVAALGLISVVCFIIYKEGGWSSVIAQIEAANVPSNYFHLLEGTQPSYVLWLILPMFIYTLIGQDVYQRLFAAKDTRTAYRSAALSCICLLIICAFPVILGMAARGLFPQLSNPSLAIPTIIRAMLPPVFSGFTLAAAETAATVQNHDGCGGNRFYRHRFSHSFRPSCAEFFLYLVHCRSLCTGSLWAALEKSNPARCLCRAAGGIVLCCIGLAWCLFSGYSRRYRKFIALSCSFDHCFAFHLS